MYFEPDTLARVTAFAVLGIYVAFQAVVLAALRQRLKGWRPAGLWNLGSAGIVVNVLALAYGIFAIILLLKPAPGTGTFLDRWIVAIGLAIVAGSGLLYLLIARPDRHSSDIPEGDAGDVAAQLREIRRAAAAGNGPPARVKTCADARRSRRGPVHRSRWAGPLPRAAGWCTWCRRGRTALLRTSHGRADEEIGSVATGRAPEPPTKWTPLRRRCAEADSIVAGAQASVSSATCPVGGALRRTRRTR